MTTRTANMGFASGGLTVSHQDCNCRRAFTTSGGWQNFMCYNLGADESLDPFTPAKGLNGNYYQWGRPTVDTPAAAIPGWNTTPAPDGSWSEASKIEANDPCPQHYRVPTCAEWEGVINATLNTQTPLGNWTAGETNFDSGWKFGPALYLPAAGVRVTDDGRLFFRGNSGYYWSSTEYSSNNAGYMLMNSGDVGIGSPSRTNGYSIRCIAE
ncbi:fibrobacter succinogenes major paralogous domain-containing protein [Dysgonomonas reticulitermitis]